MKSQNQFGLHVYHEERKIINIGKRKHHDDAFLHPQQWQVKGEYLSLVLTRKDKKVARNRKEVGHCQNNHLSNLSM